MEWLVNGVYYIVPFIVLLGILVFVHEFGHFLVARLSGVQVTDFSIGFGKQLWGFTDKHNTKWKICAIPLGGYCQFLGDADAASSGSSEEVKELSEEDKKKAFPFQNPWKKLAIVLGGPGFNYLFAIIVFTLMFAFLGKFSFPPVVGEVVAGGAADKAGIVKADRILSINGHEVESFSEITTEISLTTGGVAEVKLDRAGEVMELSVPLEMMKVEANGQTTERPMLGIKSMNTMELDHERMSLPDAFVEACSETWRITEGTLRGVGQMITGKRGSEDLGGILRIAEMSGDISRKNGMLDFIAFMALLSINLGLINLFPIPVLDGGHVVIYLVEIVSRREINAKVKENLFKAGFALILALMIFATWNDFVHLFHRFFA
ncbi:MAG: RIP metalloprotease RseP [Alphaproteobacteria bacterium]|jgi:RIP metalloprotease rseP|nr:MAG: RIP metalloprotease RseP [Azospirillum sp. 51_20]